MPNDPVQEDLIRRVTLLERRLDNLNLPEKSLLLAASFLQLPVLRGLWVSSVSNTGAIAPGDWFDLSGLGKTLTYNGNPTVNIYNDRVAYWDYDGVGDYHSRADEADLDITGTEAYVAVPGLTWGGWFWLDTLAPAAQRLTGKDDLGANRSYMIYVTNAPALGAIINGAANVVSSATPVINQWYFVVARFVPSTTLDIYVNGTKTTQAVGGVASVNNLGAAFTVGAASGGANPLNGRCALAFLCAAAASDAQISAPFQATKALVGV